MGRMRSLGGPSRCLTAPNGACRMMGTRGAHCVTAKPLETLVVFVPCSLCMLQSTVRIARALQAGTEKTRYCRPRAGRPMDHEIAHGHPKPAGIPLAERPVEGSNRGGNDGCQEFPALDPVHEQRVGCRGRGRREGRNHTRLVRSQGRRACRGRRSLSLWRWLDAGTGPI